MTQNLPHNRWSVPSENYPFSSTLLPQGMIDNMTRTFSVNYTCKETVRAFVRVDVKLTYPSDNTEDEFQFYLAKNCSLPGPITIPSK